MNHNSSQGLNELEIEIDHINRLNGVHQKRKNGLLKGPEKVNFGTQIGTKV